MSYGVDYESAQLAMLWPGVPIEKIKHFHKVFVTGIPEEGSSIDYTILRLRDDVLKGRENFLGGSRANRVKARTYAYAQTLISYYKENIRTTKYEVAVNTINEIVDNIFKHVFSEITE